VSTQTEDDQARRKAPVIPDELLDQLLAAASRPGQDGLVDELKRALAELALNAEMDSEVAEGRANSRNGYGRKTLLTDSGKLPIVVLRDRLSTFDP
jgi:putative transposase